MFNSRRPQGCGVPVSIRTCSVFFCADIAADAVTITVDCRYTGICRVILACISYCGQVVAISCTYEYWVLAHTSTGVLAHTSTGVLAHIRVSTKGGAPSPKIGTIPCVFLFENCFVAKLFFVALSRRRSSPRASNQFSNKKREGMELFFGDGGVLPVNGLIFTATYR